MARKNMALNFHANQIEALTGRRVLGGTITRRGVSFRLVADVAPDLATLRDMFGRGVRVRATGGEVSVEAGNGSVNRVPLGQLIAGRELPRMAAALGINEAGAPMLLNLTRPVSRHLLISGDTVAGQSLLHTMALSLVMLNRQRDLQLVAIGNLQHIRRNWPHLLNLSLTQVVQLAQSVTWIEQKQTRPHLVVVIENLDWLNSADQNRLRSLLTANASAGIHVIATAARPADWPGFLAQAWSIGDVSGLFRLVAGSDRAEVHTATATVAETEAAIIQLRTGRKSRVWTVQETLPTRSASRIRRLLRK